MSDDRRGYDIQTIRQLLREAFTQEQLRRACLDSAVLRPVVDDFGSKYSLNDMVDQTIDYCRTQHLFDDLLEVVERENPSQYTRFEKDLWVQVARTPEASMLSAGEGPAGSGRHRMYRSAGGDITIQQFISDEGTQVQQLQFFRRQMGLETTRGSMFAKSQFEAYSDVWKTLQALRLAGDDLWEEVSGESILKFSDQLRKTYAVWHKGEIFFEEEDRTSLVAVLDVFWRFQIGKTHIFKYRSRQDAEELVSTEHRHVIVKQLIERNRQAKDKYERLLDEIRVSFRNRLSNL